MEGEKRLSGSRSEWRGGEGSGAGVSGGEERGVEGSRSEWRGGEGSGGEERGVVEQE